MSEEHKDPKPSEPGQCALPETEYSHTSKMQSHAASFPAAGARTGDDAQSDAVEQDDDYVSEIRQLMASKGSSGPRKTGGLIRRLTGLLRWQTIATLPDDSGQASQTPPPSLEDTGDFLAGDHLPLETASSDILLPIAGQAADQPADGYIPAFLLSDDLEEELSQEVPDWMAEIRLSAAEGLPPVEHPRANDTLKTEGPPPEPARSGPLSFITGLLRGAEARSQASAAQPAGEDMADDMVTGRLGRSLQRGAASGGEDVEESAFRGSTLQQSAGVEGGESMEALALDDLGSFPLFTSDQELLFNADLDARFYRLGQMTEPLFTEPAEEEPDRRLEAYEADPIPTISAEDEQLLWGESAPFASFPDDGPTFTPEDIWGIENAPAGGDVSPTTVDDLFAENFLLGIVRDDTPDEQSTPQPQLLRSALEKSASVEESVSLDALRQVALQGYQGRADSRLARLSADPATADVDTASSATVGAAYDASFEDAGRAAAEAAALAAQADVLREWEENTRESGFSLWRWLSKRTLVEKILLVEAAVVVVVLLFAVPFFIYLINRGPAAQAAELTPRSLPAGLPYPSQVELPGGWQFALARSTFVDGRWQPTAPEWLDGTELRRVVALPWNPQTEAVLRSFKSGDPLLLTLSNGDTADYSITSVERVASSDNTIFTDMKPSLVIILYQEAASERWVVFSE